MNPATLEALKASIEHWEQNLKNLRRQDTVSKVSYAGRHCALCCLFVRQTSSCEDCPVAAKTGFNYCNNSPYLTAACAINSYRRNIQYDLECCGAVRPELKSAALKACHAEIKFLKSLLPKKEKQHAHAKK